MIITKDKSIQEILDELAHVLIKQGKRCIDSSKEVCMYGDDTTGHHCAVGWFLPTEGKHNLMAFEGTVDGLTSVYSAEELGKNGKFIHEQLELLTSLQLLHDEATKCRRENLIKDPVFKEYNMDAWEAWINLGTG